MMKKAMIILHIGMGKTGTTVIQDFLFHNRDTLRREDISYPLWADYQEYANHNAIAQCLSFERHCHLLKPFFDALHAETVSTLIISGETLSVYPERGIFAKALNTEIGGGVFDKNYTPLPDEVWIPKKRVFIEEVRRLLPDADEYRIVVFLRRQDLWLESLYNEDVKGGSMKKKIVVCHVIFAFDRIGGLENGVINVINRLPGDLFFHIICALTQVGDLTERISAKNVRYYSLNKREGNDPKVIFQLYSILKKEQVDVVHLRNWETFVEGYVPAKIAGVDKIIYSEHNRYFEDIHQKNRLRTLVKKYLYHRVDTLLCVGEELKDELIELYNVRRTVEVIINGVDSDKFCPTIGKVREQYGWKDDELVIGTVGRLVEGKEVDQLIESVLAYTKDWKLVIVGDGPEMPKLKKIVAQQDRNGCIVLLGNRNDVPQLLNCFDVFVLPSISEGLSNVLLEAMSCGLPIVAYDVGGNPSLVKNGEGGYLIELGNMDKFIQAVDDLLMSKELRRKMGTFNRNRVLENYSIDHMVQSYHRLYAS